MQLLKNDPCKEKKMKKDLKDMIFGFVGLGLMGGSLAKAVRENILNQKNFKGKIYACDIDKRVLQIAKDSYVIDKGFIEKKAAEMLSFCDIVYICLYPQMTRDFLIHNASYFKKNSIVTDISGVKGKIINGLPEILSPYTDFIPGHPMAGSEKEGFVNSSGNVFYNRNYIILPQPCTKSENLIILKDLITMIGFGRIIETDSKTHDHKIAFTSQLCHVIASALVTSAEDEQITEFGGGSFEDLTRIALINAPLWTELFLADKEDLLAHIDVFEKSLNIIRNYIQNDDKNGLENLLKQVRKKRSDMSRIDIKV